MATLNDTKHQLKIERAVKLLADHICTIDAESRAILEIFIESWVKYPANERTTEAVLSCLKPSTPKQSGEVVNFKPRLATAFSPRGDGQGAATSPTV